MHGCIDVSEFRLADAVNCVNLNKTQQVLWATCCIKNFQQIGTFDVFLPN